MAIALQSHPSLTMANRGVTRRTINSMAPVYRRRRAMVSIVLAILAVSLSFAMLNTSAVADEPSVGDLMAPRTVIAQPGDTLWAIAQRISPQGNITELVDQLVLMNGDMITPGQQIRIP